MYLRVGPVGHLGRNWGNRASVPACRRRDRRPRVEGTGGTGRACRPADGGASRAATGHAGPGDRGGGLPTGGGSSWTAPTDR